VSQGFDALRQLVNVDELTGRRRNRGFAYRRYLALLKEGMELPLSRLSRHCCHENALLAADGLQANQYTSR